MVSDWQTSITERLAEYFWNSNSYNSHSNNNSNNASNHSSNSNTSNSSSNNTNSNTNSRERGGGWRNTVGMVYTV